jgi:hypothetical protein
MHCAPDGPDDRLTDHPKSSAYRLEGRCDATMTTDHPRMVTILLEIVL